MTDMANGTNITTTPPDVFFGDPGIYSDVMPHLSATTTAIAVIGAVENLVALVLFQQRSSAVIHQRRGFTISLAAADLLLSVSWLITFICQYIPMSALSKIDVGALHKALIVLQWGSATTSLWSLFSLVMDRYLNVQFPFDHERRVPKSRIPFICVAIWVFSFLANSVNVLSNSMNLSITITLLPRVPPAVGTIAAYLLIHCIAVRSRWRLSRQSSRQSQSEDDRCSWNARLRDVKKSVLLFSITCSLSLMGAVAEATQQILQLKMCGEVCPTGKKFDPLFITHDVAMMVIYLSAALNPWIHTFRQREFWKSCTPRSPSQSRSASLLRQYSSPTERSTCLN